MEVGGGGWSWVEVGARFSCSKEKHWKSYLNMEEIKHKFGLRAPKRIIFQIASPSK